MVRPWRAPTTDERLHDTFYGERYPGQPDKAKGHLNSVSAVQRLFSTWWQVKDSNVRSFRDGSRVLRRQARYQGLSRGRDAGLAVFTAQLSYDSRLSTPRMDAPCGATCGGLARFWADAIQVVTGCGALGLGPRRGWSNGAGYPTERTTGSTSQVALATGRHCLGRAERTRVADPFRRRVSVALRRTSDVIDAHQGST